MIDRNNCSSKTILLDNIHNKCAIDKTCVIRHTTLTDADLSSLTFRDITFVEVSFIRCDFHNTKFRSCRFTNCYFEHCQLSTSLFDNVIFDSILFEDCDLKNLTFYYSFISSAHFIKCDCKELVLKYSSIISSTFEGSDMTDMCSCSSTMIECDMTYSINFKGLTMHNVCPSHGSFIGWKKIFDNVSYENVIVKLQIPANAKRSSATTRKCRCNKAKVLGFYSLNGKKLRIKEVTNFHAIECTYTVGKYVYPDNFDENRWDECSKGIHFFITFEEAVNYRL